MGLLLALVSFVVTTSGGGDLLQATELADEALARAFEQDFASPEKEAAAFEEVIDLYTKLVELQKSMDDPIIGDMHQLSLLLMSMGKWEEGQKVVQEALEIDPFDFKSLNILGYSHEGMRKDWNQKPFMPDGPLADIYRSAENAVADEIGLLERFYHKLAEPATCCAGQSRWVAGLGVHYKMTVTAVVKVLAYHEYQLRLGNHAIPQLAVLSTTPKGDTLGLPALNPKDTVKKFAEQDFMLFKDLLPPYVRKVAVKYYGDAFGRCTPTDDGKDTVCTKAPKDIFPENGGGGHVHSISSDRFGYFLNEYMKPLVEFIAGRRLQVSYSYFVQYRGKPNNPGLLPHVDMIDNEYTLTISVDWSPEEFGPVHCAPIYALCTHSCTVHPFMHCAPIYALCTHLCTVHPFMHCAPIHALCTHLCTVHPFMHCAPIHALCTHSCTYAHTILLFTGANLRPP
jgi:hypothetical protein